MTALGALRDKVIKPLLAVSCHASVRLRTQDPNTIDQHYEICASAFNASSARSESPPETSTSFLASCASAPNRIYRENIVSKAPDLKPIYRGGTVEDAEQRLTPFGAKWDATYPTVSR
ncbi:MAG: hypothetical protein M3Y07_10160, partial [Acidobacteriota bacterium]|nr:hypothetical protein [Acidobacteriota bacterium]